MSHTRYEVEYIFRVFAVLFMSATLRPSKDGRLNSSDAGFDSRHDHTNSTAILAQRAS